MIKINSFAPTNNFIRSSWEFHDDQIVVKIKSLKFDYDNEVKYERIKSIQSRSMRELSWIWTSSITFGLLGLVSAGLNYFCITSPAIDVIEKIVAAFALAMLLPAWGKYEYYSFLDADKNFLATVRVNKKTKQTLLEAIKLVKQKTEIISETYFDDFLPNSTSVFQFSEFDFADFLNKSKVSIYDDKIIAVEKSLAEEVKTVIKFNELSGKVKVAKMGNDKWNYVWSYWLCFLWITGVLISTFFAEQLKGNYLYFRLFYGGLALLIPLFFLKYIKSEILIFYDKQDNSVFWTRVNRANRENLNQIVEFIKGKVESQI